MTKTTTVKNETEKNKEAQKELFADASVEALLEIAAYFGVPESKIPENPTKEQVIELLAAAKRHEIQVAKTVKFEGKDIECPIGHMVIKVTPKNGIEWGNKSKEAFFFCVQGDVIVGKRGVPQVVHEKYKSAWSDAVRYEYEMDGVPNPHGDPPKMVKREVFAEDVQIIHHNPDLEAAKKAEEDLIEGSRLFQAEKKAEKLAKAAFYGNFTNK